MTTAMRLVQVLCLTHSEFVDARTNDEPGGPFVFHEMDVPHPDPEIRVKGGKVKLGVAQMSEELYEAWYRDHPSFALMEVHMAGVPQVSEETEEDVEDDEDTPPWPDEEADSSQGEAVQEEESEGGNLNPLAGVNFQTDRAGEVAAEMGLTAKDFEGIKANGSDGGFLIKDVRQAAAGASG